MLGAETAAGRALARALAAEGARLALVAAATDPAVAFEVQRLSRQLGAASQAIDATNEMAVRVMVRQVSKALGGLDLMLFCAELGERTPDALRLAVRFAAREIARGGGGTILALAGESDIAPLATEHGPQGVRVLALEAAPAPDEAWARGALARLADPPHP